MTYWKYYDPDFDWDDAAELVRPDPDWTRERFAERGFSESEIAALIASGYVMVKPFDVVIDRFHGGALSSTDGRTRVASSQLREWLSAPRGSIPIFKATSTADVLRHIDHLQSRASRPLVFRGQTRNYPLVREIGNPMLAYEGVGEVSLLPSLWRAMCARRPMSCLNFTSLSLFEWSKVVYSQFDLSEVKRREVACNAAGEWLHNHHDFEDSNDPLLQEFGRVALDLAYGLNYNLADSLSTLLQHYGLRSPVLDLTTDLDVALFFATHELKCHGGVSSYSFVGTNCRNAVLYVFRRDAREMTDYTQERVLNGLKPLRPHVQSCVICRTGPFAVNLCADFLVGLISLDFDDTPPGRFAPTDLFPSDSLDTFLAALKQNLLRSELLLDIP
jgi:hypothetical protein